jgi:large subunit ribosomal protein L22
VVFGFGCRFFWVVWLRFDVVETALANASSALKVPKDMLEFKKLYADQGIVMKRYRAGSRGSPRPVLRRLTHVTVVLGEKSAPNVQQQLPKIEKEEAKSAAVKKTVRKTKSTKQSEVAKS